MALPLPHSRTMLVVAVLSLATARASIAQDEVPVTAPPAEWTCRFCPFASGLEGSVEAGAIWVSADALRFGDYTGLEREGGYLLANADLDYRGDSQFDMALRARDLGLDGRTVDLAAGRAGAWGFHVAWQELPHLRDVATTPFQGAGDGRLELPPGWTSASTTGAMDDLGSSLRGVDLRTDRQRLDLGALFSVGGLEYRADVRRDRRSGTRAMGGAFLVQSSLLPQPIDEVTDRVEFGVALEKPQWQWRAGYFGSYYRNAVDVLDWQNPYDPLSPGATQGRLPLAPDNQAHQFSTALALQSLPRTTLAGQLALGRMSQDAAFVPVTTHPDLAEALPRGDAGARVDTLAGTLRSGTRLTPGLRLNLEYRLRDRDNRTPVALYPQVQTDVYTADPRFNRPYDFTSRQFRAWLNQRLPLLGLRVAAGYDTEGQRRSQQSVDRTREDTVWGRLIAQPTARGNLELRLSQARRDGAAPSSLDGSAPPENPRQRQFNLADRDRSQSSLRWSVLQDERWTWGLGVDYAHDDYADTVVGLTAGREFNLSADLAWTPTRTRVVTAWAGRGHVATAQSGSRAFAEPDWSARNRDRNDTLSVAIEERDLLGALDLSATATLVRSRGQTQLNDGGVRRPFPDLESQTAGLGLRAQYRLRSDASLVLALRHEQFRSDDWQRDGLAPDTVANLLATGLSAPDYRVNLALLSLVWQLGGAEE